jgi:hypothetical protein
LINLESDEKISMDLDSIMLEEREEEEELEVNDDYSINYTPSPRDLRYTSDVQKRDLSQRITENLRRVEKVDQQKLFDVV